MLAATGLLGCLVLGMIPGSVNSQGDEPITEPARVARDGAAVTQGARLALYFDAALGIDHVCSSSGDTVRVLVVLENAGTATALQFLIQHPVSLTRLSDTVEVPGAIKFGSSDTGVIVAWSGPRDASGQLHVLTVAYLEKTGCLACSTPRRNVLAVPDPAHGSGQIVWVDHLSVERFADGDTVSACDEGPRPNIIVSGMTTPSRAFLLENIEASTNVTVKNVGDGAAVGSTLRIYYSADAVIEDEVDLVLTNGSLGIGALDPGDSVVAKLPGLAIPGATPPGPGYLGTIVDATESVAESSEDDNALAVPVVIDALEVPSSRFALQQNFPNPFNPTTTIAFWLPEDVAVRLTVYDSDGRFVRRLVDDALHADGYRVACTSATSTRGLSARRER